jgi:HD-like signal output (HDOD) protein
LDVVKALALSVQVFSSFQTDDVKRLKLSRVWPHSLSTASLARKVAVRQKAESAVVDLAFTAGLLHDMGKLILATNVADEYQDVLTRVADTKLKDWQGEYIAFGVTHAEVGGYLIGLWGLPDALVEAIALHHRPASAIEKKFGPLAAVHLADALEHHRRTDSGRHLADDLDTDYVGRVGLSELVADPASLLAETNESKE